MKLFSKAFSKEKIEPTPGLINVALLRQEALEMGKRVQPMISRVSLILGGLMLVGGVSSANWGVSYVQAEDGIRIAQELSRTLNRPIKLGAVERVSWTGIRLGSSIIPATQTDADQVTAKAVEINFNPIDALKNRQLKLTITLVEPTAYFDQDVSGNWLNSELITQNDDQVEIEQIRLQDATITLEPRPITLKQKSNKQKSQPNAKPWDISDRPTQMTLRQVDADFSLPNQTERLVFEVSAQPSERGSGRGSGRVHLKGSIRFDTDQLNLAVQTQALQIQSLMPFVPTNFKLDGGVLNADVVLQTQGKRLPIMTGTAELQNGAGRAKGEPNSFTGLNGQFQFDGREAILKQGQLRFGQIPFQLQGKINFQRGFDLKAKVASVDAAPFMQTLKLKVPFPVEGTLKADDLRLTGSFRRPVLAGTAYATNSVKFDRVSLASVQGQFRLSLAERRLWLESIQCKPTTGGLITTQAQVWLKPDNAEVNVKVKGVSADQLAQIYRLKLPYGTLGQVNADAQVMVVNQKPSLNAQWYLSQGNYPAQGKVNLAEGALRFPDTVIQIGDGTLTAEAEVKQGRWQASFKGQQILLSQVKPNLPGQLQGQLQLSGNTKDFSPASIQAKGQAVVQINQGTVQADLAVDQGRWQAKIAGAQVPLNQIAANESGDVNGEIYLNGSLTALDIAKTTAAGNVQISQGVAFLNAPLTAKFAWNGEKLQLKQAQNQNITVNGWITPTINDNQISNVKAMDLNVDVRNYDLASLSMTKILPIAVTGLVSLKGRISGTPDAPQVNSSIQVNHLAVQDFQFEPQLRGQIQSQSNQQLSLDLKGKQDRLALVLNAAYRPAAFSVQLNQARAEGQLIGDRLIAQIRNFSLEKLNLAPAALGIVRGVFTGNIEANLANLKQPVIRAAIDIAKPGIGMINAGSGPNHQADRFTGTLYYQNGVASLTNGELRLGNSRYQIAGQLDKAAQWSSQIAIDQGNFQDLLSTIPAKELAALIRGFNPIVSNSAEISVDLPKLADIATLKGIFSGVATLHSSSRGLQAEVNLQGQDWRLADYGINRIAIVNAQLNGTTLTLPSVQAEGFTVALADQPQLLNARLGFIGQVSPTAIAGQLQLNEIALSQVQSAFGLPIQLAGNVDAVATLSGTPTQPDLTGEMLLSEVNIRDMAIQKAKVGFSYIKHQFQLESWQSLPETRSASQLN